MLSAALCSCCSRISFELLIGSSHLNSKDLSSKPVTLIGGDSNIHKSVCDKSPPLKLCSLLLIEVILVGLKVESVSLRQPVKCPLWSTALLRWWKDDLGVSYPLTAGMWWTATVL